jgi:hypothetical protein
LGSDDIVSQTPKDLCVAKLCFLGSQNIFAVISFKDVRFWCDQSQGRVFLIAKGGVEEISRRGKYQFFRDNLKIDNTFPDNPIGDQGLIATYDPVFNRIILTKKSNVSPFTLSYSLEEDQNYWCFNHDYIPDYLFSDSNNFFAFKDNRIHKFNSSTRWGRYFEGSPQTSEVEIIFNQQPDKKKEVFNLHWISEVFNGAGDLLQDKTLTGIRVKTSYQDSGIISLVPFTSFGVAHNIRRIKNEWNFNKFKDSNADVYKKKSMVDNYCSVTFIFNNEIIEDSQNSLYLYLLNAKAALTDL